MAELKKVQSTRFYGAVQVVEQNSNVGCTLEEEGPLPHCDDASPSSYATAFLEALPPMEWVETFALHRMLFLARKVSVSFKLSPPLQQSQPSGLPEVLTWTIWDLCAGTPQK